MPGFLGLLISDRVNDLSELLTLAFSSGRLQHREVASLLFACPLGLTRWEFVQLLSAAREQPGGWIEYRPFVAVGRKRIWFRLLR